MTIKERFLAYFCQIYNKKDKSDEENEVEADEEIEKITDEKYIEEQKMIAQQCLERPSLNIFSYENPFR